MHHLNEVLFCNFAAINQGSLLTKTTSHPNIFLLSCSQRHALAYTPRTKCSETYHGDLFQEVQVPHALLKLVKGEIQTDLKSALIEYTSDIW